VEGSKKPALELLPGTAGGAVIGLGVELSSLVLDSGCYDILEETGECNEDRGQGSWDRCCSRGELGSDQLCDLATRMEERDQALPSGWRATLIRGVDRTVTRAASNVPLLPT